MVKHNGPLIGPLTKIKKPLPSAVAEYVSNHDLDLDRFPSAEAQVTSLADDIAYNCHDIDDGLRAGLFDIDDMQGLPLVWSAFEDIKRRYGIIERSRLIHMAISQVIGVMVEDMISETRDRLENHNIVNVEDIRKLNGPIVAFTDSLVSADKAVKKFLSENMYRHHRVNRMTSKARRVVREIFLILFDEPELLPAEWRNQAENQEDSIRARIIADYISGMTDRYALEVHKKLFDPDALS